MNQIMPVGKGIVIAIEHPLRADQLQHFMEAWQERMGDIPAFIIGEAQIVTKGEHTLFEFTGNDITPTFVAEFQRWWEEVSRG